MKKALGLGAKPWSVVGLCRAAFFTLLAFTLGLQLLCLTVADFRGMGPSEQGQGQPWELLFNLVVCQGNHEGTINPADQHSVLHSLVALRCSCQHKAI